MPFDPRNTDPGGMGGSWLTAPATAPVMNDVAAAEAQDPYNYPLTPQTSTGSAMPEWQRKGFPSEEAYLAALQMTQARESAPLPEWQSISPQVNAAVPGTPGFGGDMASDTNINYMRPGSATDQAMNDIRFNTQASGTAPLGNVPGNQDLTWALRALLNTPTPGNPTYGRTFGNGGGAAPPATVWDTGAPPPPATVWDGPTPGNPTYGRTFGEGNDIPFDVERNARLLEEQYKQRTTQPGNPVYGRTFGNGGPAAPPPVNQDPRNTGGTWTTNPNNPNSYYITGDVYTGERRGNPEGYATGFTNNNNLTEDAVTGYLSLENNRPRGMAQMVTPTTRPSAPPPGIRPNDDPVSPSLPPSAPPPQGPVTQVVVDGNGKVVAEKITLPDGRNVWNIPDLGRNGQPSNNLQPAAPGDITVSPGEWTTPDGFLPPDWFTQGTDGRPAPQLQDQRPSVNVAQLVRDKQAEIMAKAKKGR